MTDKGTDRLAAELRAWAQRPTMLSAKAVRTRVLADLQSHRRRPAWRLVGGGAVLAASALALVLMIGRWDETGVSGPPPAVETTRQMIVHQLSSGTKLYIVMQPNATRGEP